MIRRYFKAGPAARILHIGPVRPSALDRTACGHIIDGGAGWQDMGIKADGNGTPGGLDICRACERKKDASAFAGEARR